MYISSFLRGLDLEVIIKGSVLCINNVVYSTDEFIYFSNNMSDFQPNRWYMPVMNFTKALASNFSDGVVNCYEFANNTYFFFIVRFAQKFNNDIGYFLNSFLFNLLGKALTIRNILDNVVEEINNYNFYEVAYHYGRLIRTVFYFDEIELAALEDLTDENGNIQWEERFLEVIARAEIEAQKQERRWEEKKRK
jgi:hypothetical protein